MAQRLYENEQNARERCLAQRVIRWSGDLGDGSSAAESVVCAYVCVRMDTFCIYVCTYQCRPMPVCANVMYLHS